MKNNKLLVMQLTFLGPFWGFWWRVFLMFPVERQNLQTEAT